MRKEGKNFNLELLLEVNFFLLFSKSHMATLNALILHFYHKGEIEEEDVEIVAESIKSTLERGDIELMVESKELRERATYEASFVLDKAKA